MLVWEHWGARGQCDAKEMGDQLHTGDKTSNNQTH